MVENSDHRKLTAILCADVKGYSKMMGEERVLHGRHPERMPEIVFARHPDPRRAGRNAPGATILAGFQCRVRGPVPWKSKPAQIPKCRIA